MEHMTEASLHPQIIRLGSDLERPVLNELTGFLRNANPDRGLLTKPELDLYFAEYQEAARRGKASIYIAQIAPGMMVDPVLGGFSRTSTTEMGNGVHIETLYVPNFARRANVGSLLLDKIAKDAQQEGANYVQYDGTPQEEFLRAHHFEDGSEPGKLRLSLRTLVSY
jgi:ribosomal protein S18 acetylase RimI-like enzyme